jgi:hypothetical protein
MTLWSTQPLAEMSIRNLPGGTGRPERKADDLNAIVSWLSRKCVSLDDVSQHHGPPRLVTGVILAFLPTGKPRPYKWHKQQDFILYILMITILGNRQEDKNYEPNGRRYSPNLILFSSWSQFGLLAASRIFNFTKFSKNYDLSSVNVRISSWVCFLCLYPYIILHRSD